MTQPSGYVQGTLDELDRPLRDITFCVVDLETTGGSPQAGAGITEVGAVKVRGGEVLGEFQTLVNPAEPIPPFVAVLTGITDAMVASAPRINSVLPSFLEFAHGCVLVAHNASFDVGFLRAAATELQLPWPTFEVIDTVRLARNVVTKDESPDCRLSSLARLFHSAVKPEHRALADAQATVDVLHGLMERLGTLGVHSLEELAAYSSRVSPSRRRKRHLADELPHAPGVYVFRDADQRPLYVGTSKDLRTRVLSYFTASETRSRIAEMVDIATEVIGIECATALEAEVRELRLIAAHKPPYNRRSRFPERMTWLKLTVEPFPRLSLVREVRDDGATYLGPFGGRRGAEQAMHALHTAFPIRQCRDRLSRNPSGSACVLAEMGRCKAPCVGAIDTETYATYVDQVRQAISTDPGAVIDAHTPRIAELAGLERFEEAAVARDRVAALIRATARTQRLAALARCPELVAARRAADGGWEIHVVRFGRLAGAGLAPGGTHPQATIDLVLSCAETVERPPAPTPAGTVGEAERVLAWLERPGIRMVHVNGEWSCPINGAGRYSDWLDVDRSERPAPRPDGRQVRSAHQPAR